MIGHIWHAGYGLLAPALGQHQMNVFLVQYELSGVLGLGDY